MYSTEININPYPFPVIVIIAPTMEDCSKIARESYQADIAFDGDERGSCQTRNKKIVLCFLTEYIESNDSIVVHETLHASSQLLSSIGAYICPETEELLAYLQEYLYSTIKEFLHKVNVTHKSK